MATTPSNIKGLSAAEVGSLLAGTRTRNAYAPRLVEFCESDEAAINPAEVWPEFKNKPASTLYQGFMNAAKKCKPTLVSSPPKPDDVLRIIQRDDNVYILHVERARVIMEAE